MVRVEWAEPALADLQNVYEFIARDSSHYAKVTIDRITEAAARLSRFPEMGELLPEFSHLRYRQLIIGTYRLIYRQDTVHDRVFVVAVVHAGRNLPPILEQR